MFVTSEKQRGVCKLAYKSCYKEIHVSLQILMLMLVLSTRRFLQILNITRTDGDMSHFARVGIFNSGLRMTNFSL